MIGLWIAAALVCALAVGLIILRASQTEVPSPEADDGEGARRALAEIEALAERGLLNPADKSSARGEVGRRLLRERRATQPGRTRHDEADARPNRTILLLTGALIPLAVLVVYLAVGRPGLADQTFASRLEAWRKTDPASLGPGPMEAVLTAAARANPSDPRPRVFLAQLQAAQGRSLEAARSLRRAAELRPNDAALWTALGQAEVAANAGKVSPAASFAFARALRLDPKDANARYFLAQAKVERGDGAGGLRAWRALAQDLAAEDPRRAALMAEIAATEGGAASTDR